MYEAIKDLNGLLDDIYYIGSVITPLKLPEDVKRIYNHITTEVSISPYEILERCSPVILESALACIFAYNQEFAKTYIRKIELRFSELIFLVAETYGPDNDIILQELLDTNEIVMSFINDVEDMISDCIKYTSEFCVHFLGEKERAQDYTSLIIQAERILKTEDYNNETDSILIVSFLDLSDFEMSLPKLTKNESNFLSDVIAFGIGKNLFSVTTTDLEHLLLRKRLPTKSGKIKFIGKLKKGDAYRLGLTLKLSPKQMQQSFIFDDGKISKSNKPKSSSHSDFLHYLENLNKKYFGVQKSDRIYDINNYF